MVKEKLMRLGKASQDYQQRGENSTPSFKRQRAESPPRSWRELQLQPKVKEKATPQEVWPLGEECNHGPGVAWQGGNRRNPLPPSQPPASVEKGKEQTRWGKRRRSSRARRPSNLI